jgi:hypothetical protein
VSYLSRLGLQYVITTVDGVPGGLVESVALTSWVSALDAVAWTASLQCVLQHVTKIVDYLAPLAEEVRERHAAPQGGGGEAGRGPPDPALFPEFQDMRGVPPGFQAPGVGLQPGELPGVPGGDFGGFGGFAGYGQPPQGTQLPPQAPPPAGKARRSLCVVRVLCVVVRSCVVRVCAIVMRGCAWYVWACGVCARGEWHRC